MASVDWKKLHGAKEAGAKKAHFDEELRATVDHENEHIDKALSHLNYSLGAASYAEAVEALEARTKEVDQVLPPKRIRKDRVTGFSLYTVCPEEIQQAGKADEYFRKVHEAFRRIFGPENVHGSFIHKDERHEYLDTRTGEIRTSLFHAHTIVSAYVPGKGINGKLACTRSSMRTVNKALEEICREYGIEWHTGQGKESRTMDELKAASAKAERERQEELLLEPEAVREIQQRKPLLSKDEVIIKADDLAQLQQAATLAQSALEKAKKLQKERDKLRADLQAERRRAPDLIREAEEKAEQIREQAEQEAARIRQETAAELRRAERRQEALEARIGRGEDLRLPGQERPEAPQDHKRDCGPGGEGPGEARLRPGDEERGRDREDAALRQGDLAPERTAEVPDAGARQQAEPAASEGLGQRALRSVPLPP